MPMGTGKGDVDMYTALVKKGKILFEVNGLSREVAQETMIRASKKLPMKARFVVKGEIR